VKGICLVFSVFRFAADLQCRIPPMPHRYDSDYHNLLSDTFLIFLPKLFSDL